ISVAMNEGAREALDSGLDHYAMLKVMRGKVREKAVEDPSDGRRRNGGSRPNLTVRAGDLRNRPRSDPQ
ncbi:MAG: hypothetical protein M3Q54_11960, partial [Actinomycetota bacterium]|nr:hypothetical protein [Actinomycetota bacterium]